MDPKTIPKDRFYYGAALSHSWQEQMLINMVKLRYADTPMFLDLKRPPRSGSEESDFPPVYDGHVTGARFACGDLIEDTEAEVPMVMVRQ